MTNTAIDELTQFPSRLLLTIHGIAEDDLHIAESEGKWSIADVVAHLCDHELHTASRIRAVVLSDRPALTGYDQNAWVAGAHRVRTKEALVRELSMLRQFNLSFIRSLTEQELDREGLHSLYGAVSVRNLLDRVVDHQNRHLAQIERIIAGRSFAKSRIDGRGASAVVARDVAPRQIGSGGVRIRNLWTNGVMHAQLIEIDAGARLEGIDHHVPGPEIVYVVEGVLQDGVSSYPAGTFVHLPAGSSHEPQSESGCALFAFYPEG